MWRLLLIVASVIVVIGAAFFVALRRPVPSPPRPAPPVNVTSIADYGRDDWNALVRNALETGEAQWPEPELAALRGPASAALMLAPAGVIVETTQPPFTWPAEIGATYRVGIYSGERTVAGSPRLHVNQWIPPAGSLERGGTYTWDVNVLARDGRERVVPAPPAKFSVMTDSAATELEAARTRFPNDHLLLGLLYARGGVRDRAQEEFRRYASEHPESRPARQLAVDGG